MKRILAMLMLTLFLVAALAVTTGVAFADGPPWKGNDKQFHNKCTGGDSHHNCVNDH